MAASPGLDKDGAGGIVTLQQRGAIAEVMLSFLHQIMASVALLTSYSKFP